MPNLDLTDEKHAPLLRLVEKALDTDRYPLSPRLYPLRPILEKLEPQPMREPRPAPKVYAPPKATAAQRRRHAPATDRGPPDDAGRCRGWQFDTSLSSNALRRWRAGKKLPLRSFRGYPS